MGMSGAYAGPSTDEASQYIRTIHPALAERVSRFEENVAADGLVRRRSNCLGRCQELVRMTSCWVARVIAT